MLPYHHLLKVNDRNYVAASEGADDLRMCVFMCAGVRQLNEPVIITHTFRDRFTLYKALTAQHITLSMYVNLSPNC